MDLLNEIKTILKKYPRRGASLVKKNFELVNYVLVNTEFLNAFNYNFISRLYCVINNIQELPKCVVCNKIIEDDVVDINKGFPQTCCKACRYKNPNRYLKSQQTCLKHYGVENPYQSEEIKKKIAQTNLEKYGNEHFCRTKEYLDKTKETCQQKYGTDTPISPESRKKSIITYKKKRYKQLCSSKLVIPNFTYDEFMAEEDQFHIWSWKCLKCNSIFESAIDGNSYRDYQVHARCLKCFPILAGSSKAEQEIAEFVKSIYSGEIIQNDRTLIAPKEVDIYIPEKNLAIEYDGLFYHSTYFDKDPNLMVNKTRACESKGVKLLHIFEDEWLDNRPIVESYIKEALGLYDRVYKYDSKIDTIKKIFQEDIMDFMRATNLQGYATADLHLGLFRHGELLCSLSFRKVNSIYDNIFELIRICYKHENDCRDLLKHLLIDFENHFRPAQIIFYADKRFVNDYSYLGFVDTKSDLRPNSFLLRTRFGLADSIIWICRF